MTTSGSVFLSTCSAQFLPNALAGVGSVMEPTAISIQRVRGHCLCWLLWEGCSWFLGGNGMLIVLYCI